MKQWHIASRSLRLILRYPLRSVLLAFSAALGVIGVVCSMNYGASGTEKVLEQIRRLGTNVLIITPAQSRSIAGRARTGAAVTTLVERDYVVIKRNVLKRKRSSALATQSFWTKTGDISKNAAIVGCEPDYFAARDWTVVAGQLFDATHERTAARVAVLGHTVALDLFGGSSAVGHRMMINRVPFTVIGVLRERGQGLDVSNEDNQVYVPLATAMHRLMNLDHYSSIVLEISALDEMESTAAQTRSILRQSHHIRVSQPDDFQIQNQKALLETQTAAAGRLGFFLRWIGGSALAVSGLGILGITWIVIKERTRDLGTCRALGATKNDVFFQIWFESTVLALTGGCLGLFISWPVARWTANSNNLPFVFDGATAAMAFISAATLNLAFSLLPSRKAALVHPIEALRHE